MDDVSPARWEEVGRLLNDALELPSADRKAFLGDACGDDRDLRREVESLIESHEKAGSYVPGPFGPMPTATLGPSVAKAGAAPERAGPYRIEQRLGQGGMGAVYRAVRDDQEFEKLVAVKILRTDLAMSAGGELAQRFRAERQILARLEHPNVARLLDGGTLEDGRPYLVMEFVEGRPIDRFCDQQEIALNGRLEIFSKVCAAVHVAHQNLIVHRDLKPANILVGDDGEPKLLDFGIAKLLRPSGFAQTLVATQPGLSPMTLSHASPEQLQGKTITTASDVFSLGVVLFQLLTGRLPYDPDSSRDLRRMTVEICDAEPPLPSSSAAPERRWSRQLAGDLDMIVLKALRKEPERRYASVEQLAEDLRRYRKGLPVSAQGDTLRYRTGKFLRRHRWAVAAMGLIAGLTLAFIATLLVQRQQIRQEQRSAQEVAQLMIDLFDSSDPDRALGERLTARELLARGAREVRGRLVDEPAVRANLVGTLGLVHRKLGLLSEAEPLLEEALELRRQTLGPAHPAVAEALHELADRDYQAGAYQQAVARNRQALSILGSRNDVSTALTLKSLALALQSEGQLDAADETFQRSLDVARATLDVDDPVIARILYSRAGLEQQLGKLESAQKLHERALEIYRRAYGEHHPRVAGAMHEVAVVLAERQLFEESDALFADALAMQRQLYEGHHPNLATTLDSLATSLVDRGRFKEAEPLAQEALEMRTATYGAEHSKVARSINLLGLIRAAEGEDQEAEDLFRQAVGIWRRLRGDQHHELTKGLANLGELLMRTGRLEEGTGHLEEALSISRTVYGDDHVEPALLSTVLARARQRQGDLTGAESLYRQALPVLEATFGRQHARVGTVHQNLGVVLHSAERYSDAEAEIRQALEVYRSVYGEEHYYVAVALKNLAKALREQDRLGEAEARVRESLAIYAKVFPDDHRMVVVARKVLATIQERRID